MYITIIKVTTLKRYTAYTHEDVYQRKIFGFSRLCAHKYEPDGNVQYVHGIIVNTKLHRLLI